MLLWSSTPSRVPLFVFFILPAPELSKPHQILRQVKCSPCCTTADWECIPVSSMLQPCEPGFCRSWMHRDSACTPLTLSWSLSYVHLFISKAKVHMHARVHAHTHSHPTYTPGNPQDIWTQKLWGLHYPQWHSLDWCYEQEGERELSHCRLAPHLANWGQSRLPHCLDGFSVYLGWNLKGHKRLPNPDCGSCHLGF